MDRMYKTAAVRPWVLDLRQDQTFGLCCRPSDDTKVVIGKGPEELQAAFGGVVVKAQLQQRELEATANAPNAQQAYVLIEDTMFRVLCMVQRRLREEERWKSSLHTTKLD